MSNGGGGIRWNINCNTQISIQESTLLSQGRLQKWTEHRFDCYSLGGPILAWNLNNLTPTQSIFAKYCPPKL